MKKQVRIKVGNNSKSNLIVVQFNEKTHQKQALESYNSADFRQEEEFVRSLSIKIEQRTKERWTESCGWKETKEIVN